MFLFGDLIQRVITPQRLQKWDRDPILDKVLPVGRFSHWLVSPLRAPTPCKAIPPRPRMPTRTFLRSGKTPTPTSPFCEKSGVPGEHIVLGRPGKGDRIPAIWIPGSNPPALAIHPDGAEAARQDPAVARLLQDGRAVLLIDAFQTGGDGAARPFGKDVSCPSRPICCISCRERRQQCDCRS